MTPIAPLIEAFLRETLAGQRGASRHTQDSYAASFQLLFVFAAERLKVRPSELTLEQLDAGLVSAFLEHLEDARKNGNVIAGGSAMDRPGYFIEPTIVRDIKEGSRLVDEEQFGPVLPVIKYSDNEDVIRRANATNYGLGASVWSSDTARAHKVANRIEAGTVWINKHLDMAPHIPFGGAKQSGIGTEFAEEGLAEFTQLQIINGPPA